MFMLIIGIILFFGVHAISIINESWRDAMVKRYGEITWKAIYSLVSIVGFTLIVKGYIASHDDSTLLYTSPEWLNFVAMVLLIPVFPLLLAVYIPGRIKSLIQHPMLVATILWSAAHLLINGRLADILLFASFLLWALFDLISLKKRRQRQLPSIPKTPYNDIIAITVGLAIYGSIILWLHTWLAGIPLTR